MLRSFCIFAAVLTLATAARAADPDLPMLGRPGDFSLTPPEVEDEAASGWYLRTTAGATTLQGHPRGVARAAAVDTSSGRVFGGGAGYRFLPWLRADLTFDYGTSVTATTLRGVTDLSAATAMANIYWDMFTFANITPYIGAGVGFGQLTFNFTPTFSAPTGSQSQMELGWNLSAGIGWAVTPSWTLDVGYRYSGFGSPSFDVAGRPVTLDDAAAQQIRIGMRYTLH